MTIWALGGAVAVYGLFVALLFFAQRSLIYQPDRTRPLPLPSGAGDMREVGYRAADGVDIGAWYRAPAPGRATVVYFHGNAGNIGGRGAKTAPYREHGLGVLLAGYRGYGGNAGAPDEQGLYADARAALGFLADHGVGRGDTVLYGESLGGGVAVAMAAEWGRAGTPAGAVVLEAPFTSLSDAAAAHYPFVPARWLILDRFDSLARITAIGAPLLILHGARDRTVPQRLGRALFDAAREPKQGHWLADGDHTDLYDLGAAGVVIDFITRKMQGAASGGG